MRVDLLLIFLAGGWLLARAWQANRRTALIQAIHWAIAAWLAWLLPAVLAAALIVVVWVWPKAARAAGWTSRRRGDQLEALRRFSETRQTTRSA